MSESLALKWRPRRFCDVSGQTPAMAVLYLMAARRKVPDALLFSGCRGSGKTSSARILAAAMNCEAPPGKVDEWPCLACTSCKAVADGSSLDVIEVDAASNGGVAEIRKIRELVQYASTGEYHVVLLDEAQSMSRDAFNALLKVLEEPPPNTVFILLTTEPAKILPTVASRCSTFTFCRLPPSVIVERLNVIRHAEGIEAEPDLLHAIAERADGAMRDAVVALDQVGRVGVSDLARWRMLTGESDFAPPLVEAMVAGDYGALFPRLQQVLTQNGDYSLISGRIVACLRDMLVLLGDGHPEARGAALEARVALASQVDTGRVAGAMRVLWDLRTRAPKVDPRASLELALVMASERLQAPRPAASMTMGGATGQGAPNGVVANGTLTVAQMQSHFK